MKICHKCEIEKPLTEFHKHTTKDGYRHHCKSCVKERRRLKNYGITGEQFNAIRKKQNDKCDICQTDLLFGKLVHVDHDHKTGKVRGILCHYCNTGLGLFKDSIDLLNSAQNYLKK